jgi:hypothetical protein
MHQLGLNLIMCGDDSGNGEYKWLLVLERVAYLRYWEGFR